MVTAKFYTPTVTAFDSDGNLDIAANIAVMNHCLDGGVDGLVVLGSTGEFPHMTDAAKRQLIDLAVSQVKERGELIVGTSCMLLDDTIDWSRYALHAGADAVMVVAPWYYGLSDEAIYEYFATIAQQVAGPIYLYNFPDRTGFDLNPTVTAKLAIEYPNIVGYKDTLFDTSHSRKMLATVLQHRPDFQFLAGYDENLARVVASGGVGAIGGLSNVYPELCAAYAKAVSDGDPVEIARTQRIIDRLMDLYAVGTPFIPILKKAMIMRGIPLDDYSMPPLQRANESQTAQIAEILADVEAMLK